MFRTYQQLSIKGNARLLRLPTSPGTSVDHLKTKLQRRARAHGRSTEEEVREILRDAVR